MHRFSNVVIKVVQALHYSSGQQRYLLAEALRRKGKQARNTVTTRLASAFGALGLGLTQFHHPQGLNAKNGLDKPSRREWGMSFPRCTA